ncbi:MAG: hypothetical protein ACE5G3_00855 [Gammaproteobacteria bacterium]
MRCKSPDNRIYAELRSLNAGLLRLLVNRESAADSSTLGMAPAVTSGLRGLEPSELEFVAGTPLLLAGFAAPRAAHHAAGIAEAALPLGRYGPEVGDPTRIPCDRPPHEVGDDAWSRMVRLFTAALLTWLWKMDRRDPLVTALCIGSADSLPALSVAVIEEFAADATARLRVRFADHSRFWPDLICAARSRDPDLRALSRLAALPLILAEERSA